MSRNQIPSVVEGKLESESGASLLLGSPQWGEWVEGAISFRYVPTSGAAPFTVRKEKGTKGQQSYWYGYRKTSGKLYKRYIGRNEELSVTRLEEVAQELNIPSSPRQEKAPLEEPKTTPPPQTRESAPPEEIAQLQGEIARLQNQLQKALGKKNA